MINIILVSHGDLAKALVKSSEMICGKQERVEAISLYPESDLEAFEMEIKTLIENSLQNSDNLIVMSDLMYGTPFNTITKLMDTYDFHHFSGMNLAIFLEAVVTRNHMNFETLTQTLKSVGKASVVYVNDLVKGDV